MNKNIKLAVAGAVLALSASANAGIIIPAGDWTVDIGGNVNTFYTHTKYSGASEKANTNTIQTGLLPTALGIGAKTRQNDLDVAFQFSLFTGVNANGSDQLNGGRSAENGGLGYNSLNIRQAYLSVGDKSWGTFKAGRDLGVYGSDAILSDMTLLGVGSNGGATGSSTLGRIGSGYIYADWLAQMTYTTPNFSGFEASGSVHETLGGIDNNNLGFSGKASYSFAANDVNGKIWVGGTQRKLQTPTSITYAASSNTAGTAGTIVVANNSIAAATEYDARGYEVGGKFGIAGAEFVGYYYNGQNMDATAGIAVNTAQSLTYTEHDNKGGYVQATYVMPFKTKIGASWGQNVIEKVGAELRDNKREAWIVGAYHPLTKHLNLVAEYNHLTTDSATAAAAVAEGKAKTMSLGAILFF
jgi:predicted porin